MTLSDEQIQELLRVGNPSAEECRLIRIGWDAAMRACANTKDAARYCWLRENGRANEKRESRAVLSRSGKKASMAFRYWTTPEELDMTIDAMLSAAPEAKP